MLLGVFLGFSGFIESFRSSSKAVIDDFVFRLHYSLTSALLFLSAALISVQELSGANIRCYGHNKIRMNVINQYCWITATNMIINEDNYPAISANYGAEKCFRENGKWRTVEGDECIWTHSYYQWVPYLLTLQGSFFLIPRLIWRRIEAGRINSVSEGVRFSADADLNVVAANVADYVNIRRVGHTFYGLGYILTQTANALVLLGVFRATDTFLDGQFATLGLDVIQYYYYNYNETKSSNNSDFWVDGASPLARAFPRLTRCKFSSRGLAGSRSETDYLCVLAPNALSEKLFLFLWFWYTMLFVITSANLIILLAMVARSGKVRCFVLGRLVFTKRIEKQVKSDENLLEYIKNMSFGRFLFLYLLGRNLDYFALSQIVSRLNIKGDYEEKQGIDNEFVKNNNDEYLEKKENVDEMDAAVIVYRP